MNASNVCPFCLRENELGATQCVHCGVALKKKQTDTFSTKQVAKRQTALLEDRARCLNLPPDMVEGDVALFIADHEAPVIVRQGTRVTLGRYGDDISGPLVDLTPYGAIDRGVSRGHALLSVNDDQITLMDLNSTNGTWINQERIMSGKSISLQSGDRVMLARLRVLICVHTGEEGLEIIVYLRTAAGDAHLTPDFVATAVLPFLSALANLQAIFAGWRGQPAPELEIISMSALPDDEQLTIHLKGAAEAARLVGHWLMPLKIARMESKRPFAASQTELTEIGKKIVEETAVQPDAGNIAKIRPCLEELLANPLILLPN